MCKQAILVVSFGTTHEDSEQKTILAVEQAVRRAYPSYRVAGAYTSGMIIRSLAKRGRVVDTPAQALEKLLADGVTDVTIQPTHLIPGDEYDKLCAAAEPFRDRFEHFRMGKPLLYSTEDMQQVAEIIAEEYAPAEDEVLVLMGHGTGHHVNAVYPAMDYIFKAQGHANIFVGTVEGYPDLETLCSQVKKETGKTRVALVPMMLVAGDHANNDMAGDQPDSWKNIFARGGFEVKTVIRGLGELKPVQELYLKHLAQALLED